MSETYKNRKVKKTSRDGKGLMVSLPTGEGNYIDTWLDINEKTELPEGITNVNELFNKFIDIEIRRSSRTVFLNKATFSANQ